MENFLGELFFLFRCNGFLKLLHFEDRCHVWLFYFVERNFLVIFYKFVYINYRGTYNYLL
jgi:hypothetical protein